MPRTTITMSGAVLLLSMTLATPGLTQSAPSRSITQINGGVYRATNNFHGTVFLVTSEGIVLADPLTMDFAVWLKNELDMRFDVPVRYVIYSHHHWDHATGGSVFADTATFVGHANMLDHLAMPPATATLADIVGQEAPIAALDTNGDGIVDRNEATAGNVEDIRFTAFDANADGRLTGAEIMRGPVSLVYPPELTYSDELEIRLGGKRVRMEWVGKMNHSMDSSLITFPDDDVMFVVDYVTFGRLPYREMDFELGRFDEWMAKIREAEAIAANYAFVATGHGPTGTRDNIVQWREYFENLRAAVAGAIAEGQSLEEMQQSIILDEYRGWVGYDWLHENVLGMYHFLTDEH